MAQCYTVTCHVVDLFYIFTAHKFIPYMSMCLPILKWTCHILSPFRRPERVPMWQELMTQSWVATATDHMDGDRLTIVCILNRLIYIHIHVHHVWMALRLRQRCLQIMRGWLLTIALLAKIFYFPPPSSLLARYFFTFFFLKQTCVEGSLRASSPLRFVYRDRSFINWYQ